MLQEVKIYSKYASAEPSPVNNKMADQQTLMGDLIPFKNKLHEPHCCDFPTVYMNLKCP